MSKFEVLLVVEGKDLPTVLEVLRKSAELQYIRPSNDGKRHAIRANKYLNGQRNKGISGADLVVKCIKQGLNTTRKMQPEFAKQGFAKNSCSAAVSTMKQQGKIRTTDGKHTLV